MIYDSLIKILTESGFYFKIHSHEPVLTMQDVEQKLPFPVDKLLKTLVFRIKNSFWVYVIVKGQDRVDYKKLATVFGVNRNMVIRPSPDEVEGELGLQIGGICPIPVGENISVVFDNNTIENTDDTVYCGIGRNDKTLEMKIQDLLTVSNASVHSVIQ